MSLKDRGRTHHKIGFSCPHDTAVAFIVSSLRDEVSQILVNGSKIEKIFDAFMIKNSAVYANALCVHQRWNFIQPCPVKKEGTFQGKTDHISLATLRGLWGSIAD